MEEAVITYVINYLVYVHDRTSNDLRKVGVFVSGSGVYPIWVRHNLENIKSA